MYSKSLNSDQTTSRLITYNDYRAKYNLAFLEKSYQTIKFYNGGGGGGGGGSNNYQWTLRGLKIMGTRGKIVDVPNSPFVPIISCYRCGNFTNIWCKGIPKQTEDQFYTSTKNFGD